MSHLCLAFIVLLRAAGSLAVEVRPVVQSSLAQGPHIEAKPTNCETHIAILDIADQDAGRDGLIIIIGRLGDGERSRELNQHRLHSARAYLTEYRAVRSPATIVIAEGERVTGYGRIELYIGGKLHTVFAIRRNADLSVGSCEPPELDDARQRELRRKLYPWFYQKQHPQSRRPATKS
jgi:hypothetical protein